MKKSVFAVISLSLAAWFIAKATNKEKTQNMQVVESLKVKSSTKPLELITENKNESVPAAEKPGIEPAETVPESSFEDELRNGDNPEITVVPRKQYTDDEIVAYEESLKTKMKSDPGISKMAEITNVKCSGTKCVVLLESETEEHDNISKNVIDWLQKNPEFGNTWEQYDVPNNSKAMLLTLHM